MAVIQSIGLHVPGHKTSAVEIVEWAGRVYGQSDQLRKFRFIVARSGIENRFSVVPDFREQSPNGLFSLNGKFENPRTSDRMTVFQNEIIELAKGASEKTIASAGIDPTEVTHLIAVSCTGLGAPGLEVGLGEALGLGQSTERLAVNFMGCYAAFPALRMGHYICSTDPSAKVLICCAETCTLHFRKTDFSDDLLTTALFGDGAASVLMTADGSNDPVRMEWLGHSSVLVHAPDEMSWKVGDFGFEMNLTQEVPAFIEKHISGVYDALLQKTGRDKVDYFAVHPGGKNILEGFARALELTDEEMAPSFNVLRRYGNMSSPTVLFVLEDIRRAFMESDKDRALVFAAAFGPGLTIEAAILEMTK